MTEDSEAESARPYAVRLSPQANRDVAEALLYPDSATESEDLAKRWLDGLYVEFSRLATRPKRCLVSERDSKLFRRETRRTIYRRVPGSVAYLILFFITDSGEDGPIVKIVHVRHGGRKPMTRAEARQILAGQ